MIHVKKSKGILLLILLFTFLVGCTAADEEQTKILADKLSQELANEDITTLFENPEMMEDTLQKELDKGAELLLGEFFGTDEVAGQKVTAKVVSVTDSDTIVVELNGTEKKVRFLLVDGPESRGEYEDNPMPYGKEASDFTKELLEGKTVELEFDEGDTTDRYDRLLCYVYVDGKSVQEELLKRGLAIVRYVYPPNDKYETRYREFQYVAEQYDIGVHSIEGYVQNDEYNLSVIK